MEPSSRRVRVTGIAVLLAVAVAIAGYAIAFDDESTEVTIENHHTDAYHVTAVQNQASSVTDMAFRVTTDEGTQRVVGLGEIALNPGYQNTTLLDAERATQLAVAAGENTTTTLEEWGHGEATVYIVETPAGESLYADAIYCDQGDHSFYLRVNPDGTFLSSSQCR